MNPQTKREFFLDAADGAMSQELEDKELCALCSSRPDFLVERSFRVNGISGCGHKFCSSCIDQQFRTKVQFRCPKCQKNVRREQLAFKDIEEVEYDRDRERRNQLKKIFNKTESDFNSIEEYEDYEEMVEDMIYTLVKNEDSEKVQEVLQKIDQYKLENATAIRRNAGRQEDEARQINEEISLEEGLRKERDEEFHRRRIEDLKQQEKIRKIQDAVALGETELIENARAERNIKAKDASVELAWNPVVAFLNQRPEPQPVASLNFDKKTATNDVEKMETRITAGGYNLALREERGWKEIERLSGKKRIQDSL